MKEEGERNRGVGFSRRNFLRNKKRLRDRLWDWLPLSLSLQVTPSFEIMKSSWSLDWLLSS